MIARDQCRSCQAPIVWATTLSGRPMPVDIDADPEKGNLVVMEATGMPVVLNITALTPEAREAAKRHGVVLRTSHFATCPNADRHRRR